MTLAHITATELPLILAVSVVGVAGGLAFALRLRHWVRR